MARDFISTSCHLENKTTHKFTYKNIEHIIYKLWSIFLGYSFSFSLLKQGQYDFYNLSLLLHWYMLYGSNYRTLKNSSSSHSCELFLKWSMSICLWYKKTEMLKLSLGSSMPLIGWWVYIYMLFYVKFIHSEYVEQLFHYELCYVIELNWLFAFCDPPNINVHQYVSVLWPSMLAALKFEQSWTKFMNKMTHSAYKFISNGG